MSDYIAVQEQDFDIAAEYRALTADNLEDGAVVTFVGRVRDFNQNNAVTSLTLEHYPAMTTKALQGIVRQTRERWDLGQVRVIHRVGTLALGEQIVYVGITSKHRENAFAACEFLMDYLKTQAPFWKKERSDRGERWVEANHKDQQALKRWS